MVHARIRTDPPLRELRAGFKRAGYEYPRRINAANKKAAERVAAAAVARYDQLHGGGTGKSRSRIRALASNTRAQVAIGGARAPHLMGQEFGSFGGVHKAQFPAWSGNGAEAGYFLYPAWRAERGELEEFYLETLDELLASV